ncbi:MAG: hypothetical protein C4533_01130 [Candidatus Omnitrophota bacterium]|jgi:Zn finger protein HypA/HybF involved in hydrogenase expression|nr:MAG: hypothetical protein C4533_01130 [Candidatus Omnitrophota bacterium]
MHESHLLKNIFQFLEKEEDTSHKKIKKIYLSISQFSGLSREHFMEHYRIASSGTKWEDLEIDIKRVPFGPELEINRLDFV